LLCRGHAVYARRTDRDRNGPAQRRRISDPGADLLAGLHGDPDRSRPRDRTRDRQGNEEPSSKGGPGCDTCGGGRMSSRDVAVVLLCFAGKKSASTHQDPLQERLRSAGDTVLQTTILQVDGKRKASVHDPRRVMAGTLTAAFTWGLFGLVAGTNKVESAI